MPTYQEKWNSMSVEEQANMTKKVRDLCEELLQCKDNFRLNDEYKEFIGSCIVQIITKNHFYIHHFHEYCAENDINLFDAVEACIENYKDSLTKNKDKNEEKLITQT